jgi:hypothetical protein
MAMLHRKKECGNVIPASLAPKHVAGLIMLMAKAIGEGKQPFVRLAESYLHPKHQVRLADLFIAIGKLPQPEPERPGPTGEG